jgi:curved DNA-binding protein
MEFQDYYLILGLARSASDVDVKKAYRKMALKYHPDKNPDNPKANETFLKIQEAYEVLKEPEKRKKYNQLYDIKNSKSSNRSSNKSANSKFYSDFSDIPGDFYEKESNDDSGFFSSFFNYFFARKKGKDDFSSYYKGKDIQGNISIELEEAFLGSDRIVTLIGEKLRIKIRPGVDNNQLIKIKEKGSYGELGVRRGDLYVRILLKTHHLFKRKNDDLYRTINISIYTAILGGKVQFETLHGRVGITIPQGTRSGVQLRVKGKGMPKYNNTAEYGDLFVKIQYKIPVNLSEEEKQLLGKLREINNAKNAD